MKALAEAKVLRREIDFEIGCMIEDELTIPHLHIRCKIED